MRQGRRRGGGGLSPLLANVLLDEWDQQQQFEARGHKFYCYVEGCNIHMKSKRADERVMSWRVAFLKGRLRLKVNADKSAVDRPWNWKLLGLSVTNGREPKIRIAANASRTACVTSRRVVEGLPSSEWCVS